MCIKFKSMKAFHMQLFEWLPANGVSQRTFAPRINVGGELILQYKYFLALVYGQIIRRRRGAVTAGRDDRDIVGLGIDKLGE